MSEAKLPKPVDHSMAHHLVTYAANNMIAPLVHAQIARDEYEELERQYQETVSDLSISATLVRNRTQEAETLRSQLAEAVALLRRIEHWKEYGVDPSDSLAEEWDLDSDVTAFLSRLSGDKVRS